MKMNWLNKSVVILGLLFIVSCQKSVDYRDKFTGNYLFTAKVTITPTADTNYHDTLYNYSGTITKGETSNQINFNSTKGGDITAVVSEGGSLSKPPNSGLGWDIYGQFESDVKVSFTFATVGWSELVVGIKR